MGAEYAPVLCCTRTEFQTRVLLIFFFFIFREVYMEADSFYEENDRFKKYIQ